MARWLHTVKIKHLYTEDETHEAVQISMNTIADELKKHGIFTSYDFAHWREIPRDNGIFEPVDYANKLLGNMYDFADANSIWIA